MIVYGVPSMRILKYIAVFTPEPWQGYGYREAESIEILEQGKINGKEIHWGDTHHPALSETAGDYDGEYLFIIDKANPRVAVIDLKTFETKQIVVNPLFKSEHGGTFVTPNTEYITDAVFLLDHFGRYRGRYQTRWALEDLVQDVRLLLASAE